MSARTYNVFKPKKYGNVEVKLTNDTLRVLLHGHEILTYNPKSNALTLDACGWHTVTTARAMNTALRQLPLPYSVFRKDGLIYVTGFTGIFEKVQFLSVPSQVTTQGLKLVNS